MQWIGSGANLIIMDNRRLDPNLFREARTLQRPSFQLYPNHSGRAMAYHCELAAGGLDFYRKPVKTARRKLIIYVH